jgi:hypothetical protein
MSKATPQPLTVLELRAENTMRLRAVAIKPKKVGVVKIAGRNAQGKSSLLDSIWMTIGGAKAIPLDPVHAGASEAVTFVDLGEYRATRRVQASGKTTLELTNREGVPQSSPQTILDGLIGNLSFDPLAFMRMDAKKQLDELKKLVGLDFSQLDADKAKRTQERLLVGREVDVARGALTRMVRHADAPKAETSVADLSKALQDAQTTNSNNALERQSVDQAVDEMNGWGAEVARLQGELDAAKTQFAQWQTTVDERRCEASNLHDADTAAIIARMNTVEADNAKVRSNAAYDACKRDLDAKDKRYGELTKALADIDARKQNELANAKFPVDGLSFDENGVMFKGHPFSRASGAEKLRTSLAMAIALNPTLRVMTIRDASLLDADSMAIVEEMAERAGAQVWLELCHCDDATAVVIEDGMVA